MSWRQASAAAAPYMSDDAEAAVGEALGTLSVAVSAQRQERGPGVSAHACLDPKPNSTHPKTHHITHPPTKTHPPTNPPAMKTFDRVHPRSCATTCATLVCSPCPISTPPCVTSTVPSAGWVGGARRWAGWVGAGVAGIARPPPAHPLRLTPPPHTHTYATPTCVDVHQRPSLVEELGCEGDTKLGGQDGQPALAPAVGWARRDGVGGRGGAVRGGRVLKGGVRGGGGAQRRACGAGPPAGSLRRR